MSPRQQPATSRPLSIVIPIYGQRALVERLLHSLESTVAASTQPQMLAQLVLVDDGPHDPSVAEFLREWRAPQGLRLSVIRHSVNRGFVCSVNEGILATDHTTDPVILNTDTILGDTWLDTISEQLRLFNENNLPWASLTPVSNAASIATVPNPAQELPLYQGQNSPGQMVKLCRSLFRDRDPLEVPVGVGFCMVMRREVIDQIGLFSEDFSPGNGEETDWCMRASALGFRHYLTPAVFVHHDGAGSFSENKAKLLQRNGRIMLQKHPAYDAYVQTWFANPENTSYHQLVSPFHRLLSALKHRNVVIQLMHKDPGQGIGGTEKYLNEVSDHLARAWGTSSIVIFPVGWKGLFTYSVKVDGLALFSLVGEALFRLLLGLFEAQLVNVRSLTIQHPMFWNTYELTRIVQMARDFVSQVIFFAHDFQLLCSHQHLLYNDQTFCGPPANAGEETCKRCIHGIKLKEHRAESRRLLQCVNLIALPSDFARDIFLKIFHDVADKTVVVLHRTLSVVADQATQRPLLMPRPRLFYLGAASREKGIDRFRQLVSALGEHCEFVTVGVRQAFDEKSGVRHIHYNFHDGHRPLAEVLRELGPGIVFLGSLVPETFSFTLHEAFEAGMPVFTVEDSGNIARVVSETGAGKVFASVDEIVNLLRQPQAAAIAAMQSKARALRVHQNLEGWEKLYLGDAESEVLPTSAANSLANRAEIRP